MVEESDFRTGTERNCNITMQQKYLERRQKEREAMTEQGGMFSKLKTLLFGAKKNA